MGFDATELTKVVSLHQKSYRLLQWVGGALRGGTLRFSTVHESMALAEAAREWVGRNRDNFPPDARPAPDNLDAFAYLFASYLSTSFVLVESPGVRRVSSSACYCSFCAYLEAASPLRVRQPDKKAHQKARQMKELYLASLGGDSTAPYPVVEKLLTDAALSEDISFATYGRELVRRSRFASQGEGVLVLWREIAWDKSGKPRKDFVLSAERILRAEATLQDRLAAIQVQQAE